MDHLKEKLYCPIMYCISSSDTYKNLLDHMVTNTNICLTTLNKQQFNKMFLNICHIRYLFPPGGLPGC